MKQSIKQPCPRSSRGFSRQRCRHDGDNIPAAPPPRRPTTSPATAPRPSPADPGAGAEPCRSSAGAARPFRALTAALPGCPRLHLSLKRAPLRAGQGRIRPLRARTACAHAGAGPGPAPRTGALVARSLQPREARQGGRQVPPRRLRLSRAAPAPQLRLCCVPPFAYQPAPVPRARRFPTRPRRIPTIVWRVPLDAI
jgi:hypothetical protein